MTAEKAASADKAAPSVLGPVTDVDPETGMNRSLILESEPAAPPEANRAAAPKEQPER